tara:strand:- start:3076 stop:3399 length:324 start_codon:yes stop_codon:yes gene_type:complete
MKYVFDIDGTLCTTNKDCDYEKVEPIADRIKIVNRLYDEGHKIILFTARGMGRNDNNPILAIQQFYQFTAEQLKSWNVKYHQLILGKPEGDIYIDDKGIKDKDFFTN